MQYFSYPLNRKNEIRGGGTVFLTSIRSTFF